MGTGPTNKVNAFDRDVVAVNEGLMLGIVRQHELTEAAELLNAQLHAEIAARKKAEDALVNSEKLASAGRVAAVLAHEINNPLDAVMNLLFLVQTSEGLSGTIQEYLATADGELKRIAHITRQTLGFYRESTVPNTFHIASLLDSVSDSLRAKIISKGASVKKQCDEQLEMTGFHGELRQVLANLLMNSLDAVPPSGKVTLRATLAASAKDGHRSIRITVADNGPGISRAALPRLFEPFFTTKGAIGNGLGLWISKQIVQKHNGSIRVRSCTSGPRRGTTFSVLLPGRRVPLHS